MKNIFSFKLYLQGLRKVRVAGIAMAIVMTVLNAWIPIRAIDITTKDPVYGVTDGIFQVEAGQLAPFGLLVMLFAPLLVYNMFSYLNDRKSSDFYHALPQKRICVYLSFMAAILTWIVSVLLASTHVNMLLWSIDKRYTVTPKAILLTLFGFLLLAMVTAGFMALAMTVTGTAVANCLVFILFFLFIRACGMFFLYGFAQITPMFNIKSSWLKVFDLNFFLPFGLVAQILEGEAAFFGNVWCFLYWLAVAVVLFSLSAWAYCRRRSESATKSAPNRRIQNLYRVGVTFPFLALAVLLKLYHESYDYYLLCIPAALLVWIIFELLTTKKIGNVIRTMPMLLIPVILAGVYDTSVHVASNRFYASTPERDEIASVKWAHSEYENYDSVITGWDSLILYTTEITDPDVLDCVYEALEQTKESRDWTWNERNQNGYIHTDAVTLTLTSGRKITYNLQSAFNLYTIFRNSAQIRESMFFFTEVKIGTLYGLDMDYSQHLEIWSALVDEYKAMSDGRKSAYLTYNANTGSSAPRIYVSGEYQGRKFQQAFALNSVYTPNAWKCCMEILEEKSASTLNSLQKTLEQLSQHNVGNSYASMQIDSYTLSGFSTQCNNLKIIKEFLQSIEIDGHLTDYTNAENVYRFNLWVADDGSYRDQGDFTTSLDTEKTTEMPVVPSRIAISLYLTFSDEDIVRYQQILNYPTTAVPVS